ncbi:MAG: hypothetical protein NZL95_08935 [Chitinophagales bacterium]|nr:hypothetical protein [Chitinophagales bacterium]MDW8428661.1 hypothetical protein [Chitinophagales bacterium]
MYFEFRAHHPKARWWFLVFLLIASVANIIGIGLWYPVAKQTASLTAGTALLVVPWLLFLLLPSVISAVILYHALFRPHRFHLSDRGLLMATVRRQRLERSVLLPWTQLKEVQLIDFEDNHYCVLRFADGRHDRVLDRTTGDFTNFFNELTRYIDPALVRTHAEMP